MITRFFRSFFWAILLGLVLTWVYTGIISTTTRELVLVEDKYEGLHEKPILPGQWSFIATRVVPGRVKLHRIFVGPRVLNFKYKKGLARSEMLGLDESYYIQAHTRYEYSIDPKLARSLFLELSSNNWTGLDEYLEFRIRLVVDRFVQEIYKNDRDIPQLEEQLYTFFQSPESQNRLNQELGRVGIRFSRIIPLHIYVPDLANYLAIINLGERVLLDMKLDRIRQINDARITLDTSAIRDKAWFARLDKMGELLKRHPELKEYVSLELLGDNVQVLVVPTEKWMSSGSDSAMLDLLKKPLRLPQKAAKPQANNAVIPGPRNGQFRDLTPP